ncbi:hypothetical protein ACFL6D_02890 [Spirochaetota bacterium]
MKKNRSKTHCKAFSTAELVISLFFISIIMLFIVNFSFFVKKRGDILKKQAVSRRKPYTSLYYIKKCMNNMIEDEAISMESTYIEFFYFDVYSDTLFKKQGPDGKRGGFLFHVFLFKYIRELFFEAHL